MSQPFNETMQPPHCLKTSHMPAIPALAVALRPSMPMSATQPAKRQFTQKLNEYRAVRREGRNGPPATINPSAPHCYHFNRWEHCYVDGAQCCAPECDRTIGNGIVFLLQCERCMMRACWRHQRRATTHSRQHAWGPTNEQKRKTFL
jgi:hypothetical protein